MQKLVEICLTNAVLATGLAVVAVVVGRVCRRPAVSHTLWLLVLLKLLTPPFVSIPWTLPAPLEAALAEPAPAETPPPIHDEARPPEISGVQPLPVPDADDLALADLDEQPEAAAENAAEPPSAEPRAAPAPVTSQAGSRGGLYWTWACTVWLAGSALWFGVAGLRMWGFHRLLRYGRPAPAFLQAQARLLAERLGLSWCPTVWVVPGRISPLLWALGARVRLVLPEGLLDRLGREQQATLLAHELAHARRHDHWVRWLELAATSLYWWHPVAWYARLQLQQAEEQCCDAWVVWLLPAAAKAYAKALLQTVDFLDARPALPPVASGIGHVYLLQRRLTMIVREPLSPRLPWALRLGTVFAGLLVLPIAPLRLDAQSPSEDRPVVVADEQEQPAAKPRTQDPDVRDLDRRLRQLEQRMDRLLRTLESRTERQGDRRPETQGDQDAQKRAREEVQRAREQARKAQEMAREAMRKAQDQLRDELKKAHEQAHKAHEQALKDMPKSKEGTKEVEKKAMKLKEGRRLVIDGKVDPDQLKDLDKQIHAALKQAFDSDRVKQLEMQIHESVSKSLNPERVKQLEKQIHQVVERSLNPERMEALARQIEAAVARSLDAEKREQARKAAQPRAPEAPAKPQPPARTRAPQKPAQPGAGGDRADLERRIERLEQRMERLLQALEKKEESGR